MQNESPAPAFHITRLALHSARDSLRDIGLIHPIYPRKPQMWGVRADSRMKLAETPVLIFSDIVKAFFNVDLS